MRENKHGVIMESMLIKKTKIVQAMKKIEGIIGRH